eukprot:7828427-Pyramimonas_sp.AAC.1
MEEEGLLPMRGARTTAEGQKWTLQRKVDLPAGGGQGCPCCESCRHGGIWTAKGTEDAATRSSTRSRPRAGRCCATRGFGVAAGRQRSLRHRSVGPLWAAGGRLGHAG